METIKMTEKFVQKQKDTVSFDFELFSDGKVFDIPENAVIRFVLANNLNVLINKQMTIVDRKNGKVRFVLEDKLDVGKYNCEIIATFDDEHLTFPTEGYQTFQINKNLESLPVGELLKETEYEILLGRIEDMESEVGNVVTHAELNQAVENAVKEATINIDMDGYAKTEDLEAKQDKLVSGTNIKTINGASILGNGNITIEGGSGGNVDLSGYVTDSELVTELNKKANTNHTHSEYATKADLNDIDVTDQLATKQDTLVSGTNIKTINGTSILGSGNITVESNSVPITVVTITIDDSGNVEEEEPQEVAVTGLTLDLTNYNAKVGGYFYINPVVLPTNATNRNVTWQSNANNIATVDEQGFVECVGVGDAVITCTTVEGGFTATCTVNVAEATSGGDVTPTTYTVTNNLTNVSSSNSASNVTANASYTATLTANSGYVLDSVTVTMGGTNVTSSVYTNGTITISSVTGNIVITATATEEQTEDPETPNTSGKVQFSTLERTSGGIKADGSAHTLGGTYYVTIPYTEGMAIRTLWNGGWNIDPYPAIVVLTNGTYSTPTYTTGDSCSIGGKVVVQVDCTLTGYDASSSVIVNMLIGTADTTTMDEIDCLYYIAGGNA